MSKPTAQCNFGKIPLISLMLFFTLIFPYQNCGIRQPGVDDASSLIVNYTHSGQETSCTSCHESARPNPESRVPLSNSVALNESAHGFFHQTQFGGQADCIVCHLSNANQLGSSWLGGLYNHKDQAEVTIKTCLTCHNPPLATPASTPSIALDHSSGQVQGHECSECHSSPGTTWLTSFSHTPTPTQCASCHLSDRPASVTKVPTVVNVPIDQSAARYLHNDLYGALNKDCVTCHSGNLNLIGKTWINSGSFNHTDKNNQKVATCKDCHEAPLATPNTTPAIAKNHSDADVVGKDCVTCHANAGGNWATTAVSHSPLPTSCNNCHANSRPAPTVRYPTTATQNNNVYFHSGSYNGNADCALCHSAVAANAGTTWAGGRYNHTSSGTTPVTTCLSCHNDATQLIANFTTNAVPSNLVRSFVHLNTYIGSPGECYGCHATRLTDTKTSSAWAGGVWRRDNLASTSHRKTDNTQVTTCLPCHSNRGHRSGQECYQCHKGTSSW